MGSLQKGTLISHKILVIPESIQSSLRVNAFRGNPSLSRPRTMNVLT